MKQLIINLEDAYKELVDVATIKSTNQLVSLRKAIDDIKKFDQSHRYNKIPKNSKKPRWEIKEIDIIEIVCEIFGCSIKQVFEESRRTHIVQARHMCAYILHKEQRLTQAGTGELIGQDHASVLWSCGAVLRLINKDSAFVTKKDIIYSKLNRLNSNSI